MVAEFVSPSSKETDYVDKPEVCAAAGVPYFMRVEAGAGQVFEWDHPFPMRFDPAELLS